MIAEITFTVEVDDVEDVLAAVAERTLEEDNACMTEQDVREEWSNEHGQLDVATMVAWLIDTGIPGGCETMELNSSKTRVVAKDWADYHDRATATDELPEILEATTICAELFTGNGAQAVLPQWARRSDGEPLFEEISKRARAALAALGRVQP